MSVNSEPSSSVDSQRFEKHSIESQADYWVARLAAESVSTDERMQFALWLQQSEQHQAAYEEAMILLQEMEQACNVYYGESSSAGDSVAQSLEQDIEQLLLESGQHQPLVEESPYAEEEITVSIKTVFPHNSPSNTATYPSSLYQRSAFYAIACSVLLAIGLFLLPSWSHLTADYSTGFAETQQIELEDGSLVTLNSNSALSVEFTSEVRQVSLLTGEAFFQVSSNADRPYVVRTANGQTRVLGTEFNVNTRDQSTRVDVFEGVVEVESGSGQQQTLTKGEYRRFDQAFQPDDENARLQQRRIQDWLQGVLVVQNESLEHVLEQLNDNYSGHLLVLDEVLLQKKLNGVFSLQDRDLALQVLELSLNLQSQKLAGLTLLYQ